MPGGALFVNSNASLSLFDVTLSPPGNHSIFIDESGQIMAEQVSILPGSDRNFAIPQTLMLGNGSQCTICSPQDCATCLGASGSSYITTKGFGVTDLNTGESSVDFTINAKEGTLRFIGNSTQPILVGPGGTLRGSNGALYIANRGTLKTGSSIGTTTILTDLIQMSGSTLIAEIAINGTSDLYLVGGNAELAGNLFVLAERGVYFKGDTFTFLTTGGVVNSTFDSTSANFPGLSYKINYLPQGVQIEILENLLSFDADSFDKSAAKVYPLLVNATVTHDSDLAQVITRLNFLDPPDDLARALTELAPASFVDLNWSEVSTLHDLNAALLQERAAFCGSTCLKSARKECCPAREKNGLWISAIGEKLQQGSLSDAKGFKTNTYGGLIGYTRALSDKASVALAGSYSHGNLSWMEDGGRTNTNRYAGALNLAFCLGRVQLDLSAIGSYSTNHIKRELPSLDRNANSSPRGNGVLGHLSANYLFDTKYCAITPFISGEYSYTKIHSLKESGADSVDLTAQPFHTHFNRIEAGLAVREDFCTSWGIFSPAFSLSYVRLASSSTHIKSKFASLPDSFTVEAKRHTFDEISPIASLGFSKGNVWVSINYEGEFAKKRQDQAITFNLEIQF